MISHNVSAQTVTGVPSPPQNLQAVTVSSSQINLSWSAPSSNGGSPVTAYNIQRSIDGSRWTPVAITGPTQLSYSDIGLSPATEYLYQVTASNAAGTSPPSNTASAFTQSYMIFGYSNSTGTFLSTITNGSIGMSPSYNDYYEGEKRILPAGNALFAFYYSAANSDTMYQTSTDGGNTWSPAVSAGTGQVSSDAQRFGALTARTIDGSDHIVLLYYASSGATSTFYAKRGDVTGTKITWNPPASFFSVTNFPACGVGDCAGAVGSTDTAGNVFAAFRWPATNYGSQTITYHYEIFESSDGGLTWKLSLPDTDTGDGYRNTMALTGLGGGKMLFVDSLYSGTELYYQIFNGISWGPTSTTSGSGLSVGIKQISSTSDSRQDGLVAFTSGGNPGALRMATWNGTTGSFQSFETADGTLSHTLPSITVVSNTIHIYSISGGKIYDTVKENGAWQLPANPFGTSIASPVQLTSSVSYPAAAWLSGTPSWATVPSQPTGLTATAVSTSEIDLSWTAPSSNGGSPITAYYIQRSSNGSPWTTIATTGPSQLTYSDTGLLPYSMYSYRVIASSAVGTSPPSNTASATTPSYMLFGSTISGGAVRSTITNGNNALSPASTDYYEGEKRILPAGNALFAFYYSLANNETMYQTSTDGGNTWSTAVSASTGPISSDPYRFGAVITTTSDGANHIVLLYYTSSGTTSTFYAKRGNVIGTNITWNSPASLFSVANYPGCVANYGGGDCAAAVGSTDTAGNVFAAFRWPAANSYYRYPSASYHYEILESSDAGLTWKLSLPDTNTGDGYRNTMALAGLGNGKMLFVNAPYSATELNYQVFNGTSWISPSTTSGSGLSGGIKQISSASDSAHDALVAFVSGGHYGALRMATWNGTTGSFQSFETADGTLSHTLPSITVVSNTIHIYSISGGKIYDTVKENGAWQLPANPFGTNLVNPEELAAAASYPAAVWLVGNVPSPATVPSTPTGLAANTISSSQINLSWAAPSSNGGSAITGYKIERLQGNSTTWSTIASNTASTATTYSDTGLAASTSYTYRVSAINSVGPSQPSNTASATTRPLFVPHKIQSGLLASDSLTNKTMTQSQLLSSAGYWTFGGDAPSEKAPFAVSGDPQGLHVGVRSVANGTWAGYYAASPNTSATLFHSKITLPTGSMPYQWYQPGMTVETSSPYTNYVTCFADLSQWGTTWVLGSVTNMPATGWQYNVLWSGSNPGPSAADCTIITNGTNYLKMYLGNVMVYQNNNLNLQIQSPYNVYLGDSSSYPGQLLNSTYTDYYVTSGEYVTVKSLPSGAATVKLQDSGGGVWASSGVSNGSAVLDVGRYDLPKQLAINVYDSSNGLIGSTGITNIYGGDTYSGS